MKAKHGIPQAMVDEVEARDVVCVYCRKEMIPEGPARKGWADRAKWATIEHFNHLPYAQHPEGRYAMTPAHFGIACFGCNAARLDKPLGVWVTAKGIRDTVAPVVRAYLDRPEAWLAIDPVCLAADRAAMAAKKAARTATRVEATLPLAADMGFLAADAPLIEPIDDGFAPQ